MRMPAASRIGECNTQLALNRGPLRLPDFEYDASTSQDDASIEGRRRYVRAAVQAVVHVREDLGCTQHCKIRRRLLTHIRTAPLLGICTCEIVIR